MRASKAILAATLTLAFTVMFSSVVHAYTVVSGHPRVDIRPADLATLASRATNGHSSTYNGLIDWCDAHISDSLSMGNSPHPAMRPIELLPEATIGYILS
jgi:hypothetical protein